MSVLLVGMYEELGRATIERLKEEGDEVRVLESDPDLAELFKGMGAFVAAGEPNDADLIARAAQNVRTIVVADGLDKPFEDVVDAVIEGAAAANPDMRLVICAPELPHDAMEAVRDSNFDYIVMATGTRRRFFGTAVPEEDVARAIDAADDLEGEPRGELDLTGADAWRELKLEPPVG